MKRHAGLVKLGLHTNPIHASKLIAEYAASDSVSHVHRVFNQVPSHLRDTALWASLISAYSRSRHPHEALHLFSRFNNASPNAYVFAAVARAVASATEQIALGRTVHGMVIRRGFTPRNIVVGTAFVDMYAKCGVLSDAAKLFDEMSERNLVTWNAMVSGYIRNGEELNGLELFKKMRYFEFCAPDQFTLATVISGCAALQDLVLGTQLHGSSIVSGFESNCVEAIATMYFHCGDVSCGEKILAGRDDDDDSVVKLIKIRGYVLNRCYEDALNCVSCYDNGVLILYRDHTVIVPLLAACTKVSLLKVGKQLHGVVITSLQAWFGTAMSEDDGAIVGCALIDLYSKCSCTIEARKVFDLVAPRLVSHWNSMISCYVNNGLLEDGRNLLERMPEKNVVSWTTMMTGYVRNGKPGEGLSLLVRMYGSNEGSTVDGNSLTFVVGLEGCGNLSNLEMGKQLHAKIVRRLLNADINNVVIGTSLVDMYCKSGELKYAQRIFDQMEDRNVVTWTSITMGYAVHGFGFHALKYFQDLLETGIKPNEVTFVAVLTACSHCGLVDEGLEYFKMMKKYGLVPNEDHLTCLIDMLGRSGRLEDAFSLLEETEETELFAAWGALLGACHLHDNLELGERVANKMLMERNQMSTTHITLSNVYASAGLWNEAYTVRESWRKVALKGDPGISSLTMHLPNL